MAYMSAAEKRRMRAAETAHDLDQHPSLFDGMGHNEKTGVGGRSQVPGSVVKVTAQPTPSHAYQLSPSSGANYPQPQQPYSAYSPPQQPYPGSPARQAAAYGDGYGQQQQGGFVPPSNAPPYHDASPQRHSPSGSPPQFQRNIPPLPVHQAAARAPAVAWGPPNDAPSFDANLFGNNSPSRSSVGGGGGVSSRVNQPVGQRAPGRLPAMSSPGGPSRGRGGGASGGRYAPHPLEYDGGAPLPDAIAEHHFGGRQVNAGGPPQAANMNASSRALDEYFSRTRGPIIDDNDRTAIEDFFATDDFTEQFNARASAVRARQQQHRGPHPSASPQQYEQQRAHQQQQQQHEPAERDDVTAVSEAPSAAAQKYPLCHRCYQAAVDAELAARLAQAPPKRGGPSSASGAAAGGAKRKPPRKVPAMKPSTGRPLFK